MVHFLFLGNCLCLIIVDIKTLLFLWSTGARRPFSTWSHVAAKAAAQVQLLKKRVAPAVVKWRRM